MQDQREEISEDTRTPRLFGCDRCISDPSLAAAVRKQASARACSFCGASSSEPIAAGVRDIAEIVQDALFSAYSMIEDYEWDQVSLPIGIYYGAQTWSTRQLLDHVGWPFANDGLAAAVVASIGDERSWVDGYYPLTSLAESLAWDWRQFVHTVTRERRFIFGGVTRKPEMAEYEPDPLHGIDLLAAVADLLITQGLLVTLPAGTELHRVRVHDERESVERAKDVGTPPARNAGANRMSAAGIPMFYGSLDGETAVAETVQPADAGRIVTLGRFELTAPLTVVDFTRLPSPPSLFDADRRADRNPLEFLHGFVDDLSQPVRRDGAEHIDYVPTQVLSEFLLHELRTPEGITPAGILHRSTVRPQGIVAALRIGSEDCVDEPSETAHRPQLVLRELMRVEVEIHVRVSRMIPVASRPAD